MKQDTQTISLLVLEQGSVFPTWGSSLRLAAPHVVVESQMDAETVDIFEKRVSRRLAKLSERGDRLVAVGYVCALDSSARRWQSREVLTRALLEALGPVPEAELIMGGGAWSLEGKEADERQRLLELWASLSEAAPGRRVSIRFEESPRESGLFLVGVGRDELRAVGS